MADLTLDVHVAVDSDGSQWGYAFWPHGPEDARAAALAHFKALDEQIAPEPGEPCAMDSAARLEVCTVTVRARSVRQLGRVMCALFGAAGADDVRRWTRDVGQALVDRDGGPATPPATRLAQLEGVQVIQAPAGHCPVQAGGYVGWRSWYFRARGGSWSLRVGREEKPGTASMPYPDADIVFEAGGSWGGAFAAGWMPAPIAEALAAEALRRFLEGDQHTLRTWAAPDDLFIVRDVEGAALLDQLHQVVGLAELEARGFRFRDDDTLEARDG